MELCRRSTTWAGETPKGQEERGVWQSVSLLAPSDDLGAVESCWGPSVPLLPGGPR